MVDTLHQITQNWPNVNNDSENTHLGILYAEVDLNKTTKKQQQKSTRLKDFTYKASIIV